MPGCPISQNDVSLLLLPWAVRNILSGNNLTRWTWQSLFVSINVIVNSNDSYANYSLSSQVLTQSTLFKLCPKVALFVVSSAEDNVGKSYASMSYVIITENLFNPTMDVACKSLLLAVLDEEIHQPSPDYDIVLMATMKLIHRLMIHGRGNPKTTFQLLSSGPILIALSKVHCYFRTRETSGEALLLTKKIFAFGLFHATHHLQGFYSLLHKLKTPSFSRESAEMIHKENESGSFRCYQEELLAAVEQTLSQDGTDDKVVNDICSVVHVVSLLFQQKLEERGDKFSKKKSQASDTINMHFQMFAKWMLRLQQIVELGAAPLRSAALQSMLAMLESLLEHNVYSASQHDEGGYFFNFLAGIYNQISTAPFTKGDEGTPECIIPLLNVLVRLNHRLVHDSVGKLLVRSLEIGIHGHKKHAADILVEVFSTYEKLRQQSYVVGEILNAMSSLWSKGMHSGADFFLDLLSTDKVRLAAAQALSSCPILLVKEIFVLFEEWFVRIISEKKSKPQNDDACLYVAVDLFEIMCQSAIVDKSTASHFAEMCEQFMEKVVSSLNSEMASNTGSFKHTLADVSSSLCAWTIDLHIRCAFWLGRTNRLAIPPLLLDHLSCFISFQANSSSNFIGAFNGVALLACNRLTQIDTEMHEKERRAVELQDVTGDREALVSESEALASSIFNLGTLSKSANLRQNRHPWFIIAKHRSQWLKFADDDQISEFLRWVCRTSVIPTLDNSQDPELMRSTCGEIELLRDISFTEHNLINKRLFPEALMTAFDLIMTEVAIRGREESGEASELLSVLNQSNGDDPIACGLHYLQQQEAEVVIEKLDDKLLRSLERTSYLLRMVAAPSMGSWDSSYGDDKSLQLLCKLDFAFRSLSLPSAANLFGWETTHYVVRKLICQQMRPILSESLRKCPATRQKSSEVIERMFDCFAMTDPEGLISDGTAISAGIEHLVSCVVTALLDTGSTSDLITSLRSITSVAKKRKSESALVAFSRFVSEGVRTSKHPDGASAREVTSVLNVLWGVAELRCKTESNELLGFRLKVEGMLLCCDLLNLEFKETQYLQLLDEVADSQPIVPCNDTTTEEYVSQSRVYTIGFLALSCTEGSLCKRLINVIIAENEGNPLLDASFISLLKHLTAVDVDELLQKLITPSVQDSALRYLLLCVQYATEEQTTAVSRHAEKTFTLLTKLLNRCSISKGQKPHVTVDLSLEIVDFLLNHREVIIFREFEIAVILSHVSTILGESEQHGDTNVAVSTFSWCATILTSMFQRYSKYLYACVPSVISLYFCLLDYAMFGPDDRKVSQQFAGVCELLVAHKDVFKKHVLGIVLEFVWQIGNLSLDHRNRMLPAIYSLLDTMSTYEMQQLNASMGTEQKVLFRTVYQGYQKGHMYKGQ